MYGEHEKRMMKQIANLSDFGEFEHMALNKLGAAYTILSLKPETIEDHIMHREILTKAVNETIELFRELRR